MQATYGAADFNLNDDETFHWNLMRFAKCVDAISLTQPFKRFP